MGSRMLPYLIERFIAHDQGSIEYGQWWSYLRWAGIHAKKYVFTEGMLDRLETMRSDSIQQQLPSHTYTYLPWPPIWIEAVNPILSPGGPVTGILFFSPKETYQQWRPTSRRRGKKKRAPSSPELNPPLLELNPPWNHQQCLLVGFNAQGQVIMEFGYQRNPATHEGQWIFTSSHKCPSHQCQLSRGSTNKQQLLPCSQCKNNLHYWATWFPLASDIVTNQKSLPFLKKENIPLALPDIARATENRTISVLAYHPPVKQQDLLPSDKQLPALPSVQRTVILSQYLKKQRESIYQSSAQIAQRQQAAQEEIEIERSHKYLWTLSAWTMTETLRHTTDSFPFQLPADSLYIELERPSQLSEQRIAAFSFLRREEQRWVLSVIGDTGNILWRVWYETGEWKVPYGYVCPQQQCHREERDGITTYELCTTCQEHLHHYTSWIAVALRMIAGDFQEEVELKNPEYIVEAMTKKVYDHETKQAKDVETHYRYRVIRYLDACLAKDKKPQTKRGSWMIGKPIAENEYEVNPDAIIYVRIQPREHNRTFRHPRFTHARGKTQHIEPHFRLQPMTIATFRQLPHVQRITHVIASKFI